MKQYSLSIILTIVVAVLLIYILNRKGSNDFDREYRENELKETVDRLVKDNASLRRERADLIELEDVLKEKDSIITNYIVLIEKEEDVKKALIQQLTKKYKNATTTQIELIGDSLYYYYHNRN